MAICGIKKQKISYSITSSINNCRTSEKQNDIFEQQYTCKSNLSSKLRHRSHSHLNYHQTSQNYRSMPHDLSRSSNNSGSSSALPFTYGTRKLSSLTTDTVNNSHYYHKDFTKTDNNDEDEDRNKDEFSTKHGRIQQRTFKQNFDLLSKSLQKQSIVNVDMVFYCFEILGDYLFNGKNHVGKHYSSLTTTAATNGLLVPSLVVPSTLPHDSYPLFVTWLIGSEQKLRGCIGTFTPMNLAQGLREYAITSATNDSRFSPISRDEYPLLSCAVSILTHFEPCASYTDWDIGIHGIRIEFMNERGARRSATYLPEVALEQSWNHIQTIDSLLRKGGYKASITSDMRKGVNVTRYQSEKLTLHYNDYYQSKLDSSSTPMVCSYTTTNIR